MKPQSETKTKPKASRSHGAGAVAGGLRAPHAFPAIEGPAFSLFKAVIAPSASKESAPNEKRQAHRASITNHMPR